MKEKQFQGWVVEVAERLGWRVLHVPYPVRAIGAGKFVPEPKAAGLPDLILIHRSPPRLIFAELKGDGRHPLSDIQREILQMLEAVGRISHDAEVDMRLASDFDSRVVQTVAAYLWQPGMENVIETVLRSRVLV